MCKSTKNKIFSKCKFNLQADKVIVVGNGWELGLKINKFKTANKMVVRLKLR